MHLLQKRVLGCENSRCVSWVSVCDGIRAEDIFHIHAVLPASLALPQWEARAGYLKSLTWLLCKTGWRQRKDPSCHCSKGPQILSAQPHFLHVTCRMKSKSSPYSSALSPSPCQCVKYPGLSSACTRKKNNSSNEACWNSDTQRPSKYQHYGTGSDADIGA